MTQRALCYIRTSAHEQDTGPTQQTQQMALQGYCAMKQIVVADTIIDEQTPASQPLDQRMGGQQLLDSLKDNDINTIVIYALDRMFTSAQDGLSWINTWQGQSVALHILQVGDQSIQTTSSVGPLLISMLSGIAQVEQTIQQEVLPPSDAPTIKPVDYTGTAPYGFRLDAEGIHLLEEPLEQQALIRMWALHKEGYSIRKIAKKLDLEGHPARGNKWHATTVSRLIKRIKQDNPQANLRPEK